jgi:hypothetical protein
VDAFAAPFVQGRLHNRENLSVTVRSRCAHCDQPLTIDITRDLRAAVREEGAANPLIFVPDVNLTALEDPSIIEAF